ncbi:MAG: AAA family ATPase [Hyphomicrobiaceae bacterium]
MLVIAVLNTKGGVGKTTLTTCLAVRAAGDGSVAICDLDPQLSLSSWHERRGSPDNPDLLKGAKRASSAIDGLDDGAYDFVFIDGPPGALRVTEDAIETAHFVVLPVRASGLDLEAAQDAIQLCADLERPFMLVLNDVGTHDKKLLENARELLSSWGVAVADTAIGHRVQYVNAMTTGRTGPEKDAKAADEINALWGEIKKATRKLAKARARS